MKYCIVSLREISLLYLISCGIVPHDDRHEKGPQRGFPCVSVMNTGAQCSGEKNVMSRLLGFLGATLGSMFGWWIGAHIGFMTAFFVSILGTGIGLYSGRRMAVNYSE